jgi:OCT family organic cation transporter-like MFS transporter 18
MVITDITESRSRAEAMGFLGLSYGIGMVIGPFVGGIITKRFE